MMKKLDVAQITSELEGSAFFPRRRPPLSTGEVIVGKPITPQPAAVRPTDAMTSRLHESMTPRRHDGKAGQPTALSPTSEPTMTGTLDLAETPRRDFTLRITEREYEALDDLERVLRRSHGLTISKNTLIRCGMQLLLDQYADPTRRDDLLRKLQHTP